MKCMGIKNNSGNSFTKSLESRPNLNRKVFHIKVNAQKISTNYIRASIPLKIKKVISSESLFGPVIFINWQTE